MIFSYTDQDNKKLEEINQSLLNILKASQNLSQGTSDRNQHTSHCN